MEGLRHIAWNPRLGAGPNARRWLPRLMGEYFAEVRAALAAHPAPADLHVVRLSTKRVRYTLELFRSCYGPGMRLRLAALQRLQGLLGEVNDCAAAGRLVLELAPDGPSRRRLESFLHRRAGAKAAAVRRQWQEDFEGKERWWLDYLGR